MLRMLKRDILLSFILVTLLCSSVKAEANDQGTTYYISNSEGDDLNVGTKQESPWKSFANVNNMVLQPGDSVLLKRGDTWNERLEIMGTGHEDEIIKVSSYGEESLAKPTIQMTNSADDIGVVVKDFYGQEGEIPVKISPEYISFSNLSIKNTRLGIYIRLYETSNDGSAKFIQIANCEFDMMDDPGMFEEMNKFTEEVESRYNGFSPENQKAIGQEIGDKIGALLNEEKGNLPSVVAGTYRATGGGASEYIFPAAIFVGGRKKGITYDDSSSISSAKPALQYLTVTDCVMSECPAGVMSWFYGYNGTTGANSWRDTLKYVNIENVTITGAINGGLAFCSTNGGGQINEELTHVEPLDGKWGLIRNLRVVAGTELPYHTFPNGTTGAIFENTKNFLIIDCEFSGVTNQGNADGCGLDFESNCRDVEITRTSFWNNEGGAILIMDNGRGGHTNLLIHHNLMYGNLQNAFAEGNNRNNNIETKYIHQYNYGNQNVVIKNNALLMQRSTREQKDLKYAVLPIGPNKESENTFAFVDNHVKYYEKGESYQEYKSRFELTMQEDGVVVLDDFYLHGKVYNSMIVWVNDMLATEGTIRAIWDDYVTNEAKVAFTATDGKVNFSQLKDFNWNAAYKTVEIEIEKAKKGDKVVIEFVPELEFEATAIDEDKVLVTLTDECVAPFHALTKAEDFLWITAFNRVTVKSVERNGLYEVILTLPGAHGVQVGEAVSGITILADAFHLGYRKVLAGNGPDGVLDTQSYYFPQSLVIETPPKKTKYKVGEALEVLGLQLSITKPDKSVEIISPAACLITGFDSSKPGEYIVNVTYRSKTQTFSVVVEKTNMLPMIIGVVFVLSVCFVSGALYYMTKRKNSRQNKR